VKLWATIVGAFAGLIAWVASLLKRQGASDATEEYHEQKAKEAESEARELAAAPPSRRESVGILRRLLYRK
jgi:hypothetical protein